MSWNSGRVRESDSTGGMSVEDTVDRIIPLTLVDIRMYVTIVEDTSCLKTSTNDARLQSHQWGAMRDKVLFTRDYLVLPMMIHPSLLPLIF